VLLIPPDLDRRTGPARGTAVRGILLGALAPGILLWLAIAAIGRLLTGPIAVGAILKFAVTASVSGISLSTVGVVLMVVGIAGLGISLVLASTARRTDVVHHTARGDYVEPPEGRDPRL
jgi:Domain of unknown function (DUF6458)